MNAQMTVGQMEKTMETMRSICGPKHKLSDELIDGSQFASNFPHRIVASVLFSPTFRAEKGIVLGWQ